MKVLTENEIDAIQRYKATHEAIKKVAEELKKHDLVREALLRSYKLADEAYVKAQQDLFKALEGDSQP